jgi:divalent metal cation (Fe/Co/Zn/Cd) transporter
MAEECRGDVAALPSKIALGREGLIRDAFRLEWFTMIWVTIEAAVAIGAGIAAGSLTLIAFGADSLIELASAGVLIWRLSVEIKQGQSFPEAVEQRARRIAGGLLFALAAYVVVSAAWGLWRHEPAEFSWPGLVVAAAAIPIMYWLSRCKLAVAEALGIGALRADAIEAITCGYLSAVVLVGLAAQLLLGAWWIDSVTSLAIVWLLVKEGREAWNAEECGCEGSDPARG